MNVHTTISTPVGPFTILAAEGGAVRAAGFTPSVEPLRELLPRPWRTPSRLVPDLGDISKAVEAYVAGDLAAVELIEVEPPPGDPAAEGFLALAWQALRRVPPGRTLTYTQLAAAAGRPAAVRAAGSACARNPVALIVPCHRVVRTDGGLGGYRWGGAVKRWLLHHEGAGPAR